MSTFLKYLFGTHKYPGYLGPSVLPVNQPQGWAEITLIASRLNQHNKRHNNGPPCPCVISESKSDLIQNVFPKLILMDCHIQKHMGQGGKRMLITFFLHRRVCRQCCQAFTLDRKGKKRQSQHQKRVLQTRSWMGLNL